jgi:hypothetical protein
MTRPIHPTTVALLRHLRTHGVCDPRTVRFVVRDLPAKTILNCIQLGHVSKDAGGNIAITPKGREKLNRHESSFPTIPVSARPMASAAEINTLILAVLRRANRDIEMNDIGRRTKLPLALVRPAVTTLVQAGRVETTGRPDDSGNEAARYRLAAHERQAAALPVKASARTTPKWSSEQANGYTCPELQRNVGISAERFTAYSLPSRVGQRLHWPDGRVTALSEHPGLPA